MTSVQIETLSFIVLASAFLCWEWLRPYMAVERRAQLALDVLGGGVSVMAVVMTRTVLKRMFASWQLESLLSLAPLAALPSAAKVPLLLLGIDFCLYWIHRLMHTDALWRTHVLHHTPQSMHWFAGLRTSAVHSFLFTLPQVLLPFCVFSATQWQAGMAISGVIFAQIFIHSNIDADLGPLGRWLLVTPNVHRLHHGYGTVRDRNFGSVFILWDRLFGTWHAPERVAPGFALGLGATSAREARRPRTLLGV
jgi:sterol desaturase/sphingolipid hydroxylase (fatty acid hydroxylase superfamily)